MLFRRPYDRLSSAMLLIRRVGPSTWVQGRTLRAFLETYTGCLHEGWAVGVDRGSSGLRTHDETAICIPSIRQKHSRVGLRYGSDLTDTERVILDPILPPEAKCGRKRADPIREVVNAMCYVLRGGIAWWLMPDMFPPCGKTIKGRKRHALVDTDGRGLKLQAMRPASRAAAGPGRCCARRLQAGRSGTLPTPTRATTGHVSWQRARSRSRLSVSRTARLASRSTHDAESWSGSSPGSIETAGWPRTSRPPSPRQKPSSTPLQSYPLLRRTAGR